MPSEHPNYSINTSDWQKWRLTMDGGTKYISQYLRQFSLKEDQASFLERRDYLTYNPGFAMADIKEIAHAVFDRLGDVSRQNGGLIYQSIISGQQGGVDYKGSTMNSFLGNYVIEELLCMGRVGVFVDMQADIPGVKTDPNNTPHPYLYVYKTENITNWVYGNPDRPYQLTGVVLKDEQYTVDKDGFPTGTQEVERILVLNNGVVTETKKITGKPDVVRTIDIPEIPFVIFEIPEALLKKVANHNIVLLNMESADAMFAIRQNFPLYTEQFDENGAKTKVAQEKTDGTTGVKEVKAGVSSGRRYPVGTERPGFVNPSPEPLKINMEKEDVIRKQIRSLIHLSIAELSNKGASAESKLSGERSLETGLTAIGQLLETGERQIGKYMSFYTLETEPTVKYPQKWSLKTLSERLEEAGTLKKQQFTTSSVTCQKEVAKRIARVLLESQSSAETISTIEKEIDDAPGSTSDPDVLKVHLADSLVTRATASKLSGYDDTEAVNAYEEYVQKLADIQNYQRPGVAGVSDGGAGSATASNMQVQQKADVTMSPDNQPTVRGAGA